MSALSDWYRRHFSDPQVTVLALLLLGGLVAVVLFGNLLAPVIASLVIAYVLQSRYKRCAAAGSHTGRPSPSCS